MKVADVEAVLRKALSKKVKLSPDILSLLASVLAELKPKEIANFDEVRKLLEPFLLDALKAGRERPHDRQSDELVETLCQEVFAHLGNVNQQISSATLQQSHTDQSRQLSREDADKAVRQALSKFHVETLPEEVIKALTSVVETLPVQDVLDICTLESLLGPVMLDAFHEWGEWTVDEDADQLKRFCETLQREVAALQPKAMRNGAVVLLHGLIARPELNDSRGILVKYDEDKQRWQVRLNDDTMLFKEANLRLSEPDWT